jgi:hypothetical protein
MMRDVMTARLLEQARQWVADEVVSPTIPCDNLAAAMQLDTETVFARLASMDLIERTIQAVCYASYANRLLGLNLTGADVLSFWDAWKQPNA